jgi:hypothetical protein
MPTILDEVRLSTLRAAMDRLIPADEFPGAWDAGCGDYLLAQLDGQLAHLLPVYRQGLDGLDGEARLCYGRRFANLPSDQQDALLAKVEIGQVAATAWETPPAAFFAGLVNHTAEGYYADPAQGGNRERVSWRMVGFNGR